MNGKTIIGYLLVACLGAGAGFMYGIKRYDRETTVEQISGELQAARDGATVLQKSISSAVDELQRIDRAGETTVNHLRGLEQEEQRALAEGSERNSECQRIIEELCRREEQRNKKAKS